MSTGGNIKKLRVSRGLTQSQVAGRLGIKAQSYNLLENEKVDIGLKKLQQIAEIFDVEPTDLMREPSEPYGKPKAKAGEVDYQLELIKAQTKIIELQTLIIELNQKLRASEIT